MILFMWFKNNTIFSFQEFNKILSLQGIRNSKNMKQENYEIQFDDNIKTNHPSITLNEPIITTIKRDLNNIAVKLRYAMIPSLRETGRKQLLQWDLWGPFLLSLMLSITLSFRKNQDAATIITLVFNIMWVGSFVVYLNANFLGSHMSLFQSASLLGYCLFPINVVSLIMCLIGGWIPSLFKLILVVFSFIWSTFSSIAFIGEMIPAGKRKLALYPIFLFYLFLSWFILIV